MVSLIVLFLESNFGVLLTKLTEIKHQVRINTELLQELLKNRNPRVSNDLPEGVTLPLETYEDVQELENRLAISTDEKDILVCIWIPTLKRLSTYYPQLFLALIYMQML